MLDSDVDSLLDDSVSDSLVHLNTDSSFGHVENASGSSVVELVGHTLVDGSIGGNIDIVTNLFPKNSLRSSMGDNDCELLIYFGSELVRKARALLTLKFTKYVERCSSPCLLNFLENKCRVPLRYPYELTIY